jgi:NTP pyrophosphatase (non-canonical NTP hydrolase)
MHVKELCRTAHEESRRNGWYDAERNLGEMIALMHSEASEMLEAIRKPDPATGAPKMSDKIPDFTLLEEEAADLMIRLADFAEHTKLRLEDAISAKLAFNRTRGYRHGGRKF